MSNFKRLNTKIFQKSDNVLTQDTVYWKKFGTPVLVKEFGPIDYVDFSPLEPYHFAVTCSVRVQIYNPITKLVVKNLSRFRENAYGASFRSDGKLLCAGGEESNVKLFDVSSKSLLRLFKGHSGPVHRTLFIQDRPQIVSYADDKTVKTWDIPSEKNISTFSEHNDYIRAGAVSPIVPDIIISGGYDNKINMYDLRSNQVTLSVDHGSPVEALLFLPSGGIFISAGGNDVKVWDTLSRGRLLGNISEHHKTVTCLRLASENKRLLSGSLDRHVKVYDLSNFRVVHTLDFPNSVLSLGVSRNDDTLVAGLVDGVVSINRRQEDKDSAKSEKKISFKNRANSEAVSLKVDHFVRENKLGTEAKHDKCLRKFEHSKALEYVLLNYVVNKHPETTVSVIQELIKRKSFDKAIRGKDNKLVNKLMQFFIRNITNYRFTSVLIDAIHIFLNEYEDAIFIMPPETVKLFLRLTELLKQEIDLGNELAALQGTLYMLMSSATVADQIDITEKKNLSLLPSEDAQKNLVVNLT